MLKSWVSAVCCLALGLAAHQSTPLVAADQWDAQTDVIIESMDEDQLVGQMVQVAFSRFFNASKTFDEDKFRAYAKLKIGSYLSGPWQSSSYNGKYGWTAQEWRDVLSRAQEIVKEENDGHPFIFGIDSLHGAGFTSGAVLFGQPINGAATFNPDLIYEMGRIAGRDTLAAGTPWIFGPMLEISQNPLWSRVYETFGEDPYLVSTIAESLIKGIQSNNGSAACMKHWIGYSKTPTGHDKDGVTLSDYDLLNYFLPPFKAAVDAGVLSAMENYISVNGIPTIANPKLMNNLLREDLGFEGMTVSDFAEIEHLNTFHRFARNDEEAATLSVKRTSIDMTMASSDYGFINATKAIIANDPSFINRVKESARRVVKLKLQLGLYDNAVPGEDLVDQVGNDDDKAAALNSARESIVLLQNNDSVLQIPETAKVFLTGHSADNVGYQCGGWSLSQQGYSGNDMFPNGISVKDGFQAIANETVTYFNGLNYTGTYNESDLAQAKELASQAEYTIAVIGEHSYTEKTYGDINDLALPAGQIKYVTELASTGTKVIVVLVGGRPRLLGELPSNVHAVINAMLPCELGGQAIAEIIYGRVNPSGRMPITYPKDAGNILMPYNHRVSTQCASGDYCEMQWEFGHGLSYTEFTYSDLTLSRTNVTSITETVDVSVVVKNSGSVAGKETVLLFLTQPFRTISVPEVKQLKKFTKVELQAGDSTTVNFTLSTDDWSVYYPQIGSGLKKVAEDADYVIAIKPETDCDVYNETAVANPLCATFTLQTGEHPYGSFE
ncbi:Lysosomal beta glucosidase [Phytophthora fragariae]|uniref:beta-glucosidase n=2 Tax=Phytophthora fragariae TaxID=53985 RepID=A0A6A3YNW8_9STRA|nr:Lysosomal beta glucosidase [Phytophthora fragariae]KAE8934711.1 Lysosomal beta glucosidase [Phytophthora fragariae]KAE8980827.1 Lysosomal beta glucosidase [Phytophthora fragariae]KAE9079134.1 Lysosomal beta glucosidase [Phytophthora fragariae]KAE9146001.1 Lysosomal beta glucosidase [Phytophthora fragariae]